MTVAGVLATILVTLLAKVVRQEPFILTTTATNRWWTINSWMVFILHVRWITVSTVQIASWSVTNAAQFQLGRKRANIVNSTSTSGVKAVRPMKLQSIMDFPHSSAFPKINSAMKTWMATIFLKDSTYASTVPANFTLLATNAWQTARSVRISMKTTRQCRANAEIILSDSNKNVWTFQHAQSICFYTRVSAHASVAPSDVRAVGIASTTW